MAVFATMAAKDGAIPAHKKGRTGEAVAEEDGGPGPSTRGAVFEEEEEEEEDEDEPLPAEEEEEEDDEDDPRATGTGYYTAHADGRRKSGRLKSRLADLPGGEPRELAKRVHAVMSEGSDAALSDELRGRFSPRYDEWRSLLHSGFSLLLHGHASASAAAPASSLSLQSQPQLQPQPQPPVSASAPASASVSAAASASVSAAASASPWP